MKEIKAFIRTGEKYFLAECLEIPVMAGLAAHNWHLTWLLRG
jgi:hypothetical protein